MRKTDPHSTPETAARAAPAGRFVVEPGNERPTSRPFSAFRSAAGASSPAGVWTDAERARRLGVRNRPTLETAAARLTPVPDAPRSSDPGAALKEACAGLGGGRATPAPESSVPTAAAQLEEAVRRRGLREASATRETAPMRRVAVASASDDPVVEIHPLRASESRHGARAGARATRETAPMARVRPSAEPAAPRVPVQTHGSGVRVRVQVVEEQRLRTGSDPRRER